MALMDRQYLKTPFYGCRRMKAWLLQQGYLVSRKRVRRLMRLMGLEAIYRRSNTSKLAPGHRIYPYLLQGVEVNRVDQVWAADITYIPMAQGFLYLVAIMDCRRLRFIDQTFPTKNRVPPSAGRCAGTVGQFELLWPFPEIYGCQQIAPELLLPGPFSKRESGWDGPQIGWPTGRWSLPLEERPGPPWP